MQLRNRNNGGIYDVRTEMDDGKFVIYAKSQSLNLDSFCMHYHSLAEFNDEWEDV